jgi:flavodoxin I
MKVARDLTCKKAIFYYSNSGNTKAIVELSDTTGFDIINIKQIEPEDFTFEPYDIILIGTPTLGDGVPPSYFKKLTPQLHSLQGKKIGLFGSGNTHYTFFCGALDLLEDLLGQRNEILFKHKFESYPTERTVLIFNEFLNRIGGW